MSKNRDLLQEAIADAKKVKQTAIENAKQLIAESFQGQVQSIISKKLSEEDEYEDEDEMMEMEDEEMESDEESMDEMEDEEMESDEESMDEMEDELEYDEESMDEMEDELESEEDDEIDAELEEILRELEDEGEEDLESEEGGEDDELSDEDLEEIVNALSEEDEMEDEMEDEDDALEELVRALSEEDEMEDEEESTEELQEAYNTIKILKRELNETNLLNTQLLFTNKLFGSFNLTNEQKERVINIFDKVSNLKEAKLVYATLLESFSQGGKVTRKQKLKESFASRNVGTSTKPKNIVNENFVNRMKTLANIK